MSDEDLELLEEYLDGALPPREAERVSRLAALDAEWGRAVDRLRAERALRRAAWESLEPGGAFADAAARSAAQLAVHADRVRRAGTFARRAAGVAAAVLIAFAGGWVTRGVTTAPAGGGNGPSAAAPTEYQVALTDEAGQIIAVQHFSDPGRAKQFAEDVSRWQSRRRHVVPAVQGGGEAGDFSGDFSQVSDEF